MPEFYLEKQKVAAFCWKPVNDGNGNSDIIDIHYILGEEGWRFPYYVYESMNKLKNYRQASVQKG